jgi:hypothetical protein
MIDESYPLTWPPGWRRCAERTRAKFVGKAGKWSKDAAGQNHFEQRRELTIEQARVRVMAELKRFGVGDWNIIISSNLNCGPMWRVTERDAGNRLADRLVAMLDSAHPKSGER